MVSPQRGYLRAGPRLVHLVSAGTGPVLVLVHASPGDWTSLRRLVAELAGSCTVVALDTPGHGGSDPLPVAEPEIADYGAALADTLAALDSGPVHLYGTHTGAKIALSAAVTLPDLVASLFLDGLGIASDEERADQLAHYTPWPQPRPDGGHLVAVWHQVRDMFRFWPWYDHSATAALGRAVPGAGELHDLVVGLLVAGQRYRLAYRAAFRCDPRPLLRRVRVPTFVLAGPDDPLHGQLTRLGELPESVTVLPSDHSPNPAGPDPVAALVTLVTEFALGHTPANAEAAPSVPVAGTAEVRHYVSTELGQLHVTRSSDRPPTVLMLPPASASAPALRADPLWTDESALAVDLPGTGRSVLDPDATLTLGAVVDSVWAVARAHDLRRVRLCGYGTGAVCARRIAQRVGNRIDELLLDGGAPRPVTDLPDLTPVSDGGHLLAAWHFVRDAAIDELAASGSWPGRFGDRPDLDLLHGRVLDLVCAWPTVPRVHRVLAEAGWPGGPSAGPPTGLPAGQPVRVVTGGWDPCARPSGWTR